jgi:signal transduction histidine kinase
VMAANADGVWASSGDERDFTLPPHYYQTAWFKCVCAAVGILAVLSAYVVLNSQLKRRQRRLQEANELLESKVRERTEQLAEQHKQLLTVSRQAGMAEVASSVLHNVGNVLNSVNVSATLVKGRVTQSSSSKVADVLGLVRQYQENPERLFSQQGKGTQLVAYLERLVERLKTEQNATLNEVECLMKNVEHIKEVISTQQSYARVAGVTEVVEPTEVFEDALRMQAPSYQKHSIRVVREFDDVPSVSMDKHKVMQILVNLLQNAKEACEAKSAGDGCVTVRVAPVGSTCIKLEVSDNGVGIPRENLTKIFAHGFTTRKNGHGFGLHSGALAAKEIGGSLTVKSEGQGYGATFILQLPLDSKNALVS